MLLNNFQDITFGQTQGRNDANTHFLQLIPDMKYMLYLNIWMISDKYVMGVCLYPFKMEHMWSIKTRIMGIIDCFIISLIICL